MAIPDVDRDLYVPDEEEIKGDEGSDPLALEDLEIERDLFQESMNERDMLERLRTATDPGLNRGAI